MSNFLTDVTLTDPPPEPEPDQSTKPQRTASQAAAAGLSSRWASLAAVVIAVVWTIPTVGLLISSFRPEEDVKSSGWWTVFTDPAFTLQNYQDVLNGGSSGDGLSTNLVNSIVITIPAVLIPISLATLAAYAFAWMDFRGKYVLFIAVFALQIVPIQVTLVPLLKLYVDPPFNLMPLAGRDAPAGWAPELWLSHTIFALPLAIFLLHNFMREIPGGADRARPGGRGRTRAPSRGSCCP